MLLAAAGAVAVAGALAAAATTAWAFPTQTQPCTTCHSGANVPVAATLASTTGTTATYNVSAPTATAIAVFSGSTKLATITGTSGSFSVPVGTTYTIYAVQGPTTSNGVGSTTVSPTAPTPPADTVAPVTTSNVLSSYVGSALITLSAADNADGTGVAHTYYTLDGGAQVEGTSVSVTTVGTHTLTFWSVDVAGNVEMAHMVTFDVTAPPTPVPTPTPTPTPTPAPDTTAPQTTSNVRASYVGTASIMLMASDPDDAVAHTYYMLDGAAQVDGTSLVVTTVGTHTLTYWSVDAAGNVEQATTVTFTVTAVPTPTPTPTPAPGTGTDTGHDKDGTSHHRHHRHGHRGSEFAMEHLVRLTRVER